MESTSSYSPRFSAGLHDHKHLPRGNDTEIEIANAKLDARAPFVLRDKPVSIHLIRDGKISFDDLALSVIRTGPLKGRGEKAIRDAQERMLDHLLNTEIGWCRGRRCLDISRIVQSYYGGPAGVAFALAGAPADEQQAAARFLSLTSTSPALNLQYESLTTLNRGAQALSAVVRHFDQAVERITATVQASADEPQAVTALGGKEAWAYAHGRLHARLREAQLGLDGTREMRTQFFDTLAEMLDDEPKSVAELDALVEDAMDSTKPAPVDDAVVIETKASPHTEPQEAPDPLARLFLTNGAGDDGTFDDEADTSAAHPPLVKQHGDTDWLLLNHHTRPLLDALPADSKGH